MSETNGDFESRATICPACLPRSLSGSEQEKHRGCVYLVLDWGHDPFVSVAAEAYAAVCEKSDPERAASLRQACFEKAAGVGPNPRVHEKLWAGEPRPSGWTSEDEAAWRLEYAGDLRKWGMKSSTTFAEAAAWKAGRDREREAKLAAVREPRIENAVDEAIVERFIAYYKYRDDKEWGSLHLVMADKNVANTDVDFCRGYAAASEDVHGAELGEVLRRMSKTQRLKLANRVGERLRDEAKRLATRRHAAQTVESWKRGPR